MPAGQLSFLLAIVGQPVAPSPPADLSVVLALLARKPVVLAPPFGQPVIPTPLPELPVVLAPPPRQPVAQAPPAGPVSFNLNHDVMTSFSWGSGP